MSRSPQYVLEFSLGELSHSFVPRFHSLIRVLASCVMISVAGIVVGAPLDENWPQFRGLGGSGVSLEGGFPVQFGPGTNIQWRVDVPPGHSSPVLWGDRIFVTGFSEGKLLTLCLARSSGQIVWRKEVAPGAIERGGHNSNPAASTPATDGSRLYVYFGSFGLVCYDVAAGEEMWRKPLPTPITQHGASSSPVVAGGAVILPCDQDVGSYVLAASTQDGSTLWRTERDGFRRGFSTPLLWPAAKPEVAVLAGTLRLVAYDLKSGSESWTVRGLPNEMVTSPVGAEGIIYVAGWTPGAGVSRLPSYSALLELGDKNADGKLTRDEAPSGPAKQHFVYIDADKDSFVTREEWESLARIFEQSQNALLAIRPQGTGDITEQSVLWKQTRGLPYCPSPLYYDGRVYLIKNGGLLSCFDGRTGEPFYLQERVGALGDYYASPVAAEGKVCVASQPGTVVVLKAGSTLEVLARNEFREEIMATPAVQGRTLFLRTKQALYAIGGM